MSIPIIIISILEIIMSIPNIIISTLEIIMSIPNIIISTLKIIMSILIIIISTLGIIMLKPSHHSRLQKRQDTPLSIHLRFDAHRQSELIRYMPKRQTVHHRNAQMTEPFLQTIY